MSGWAGAAGWFPGHMAKASKELAQRLAKVDFVIEVRDARLPVSSAAAHLDRMLQENGRQDRRIITLNKIDLVSASQRAAIEGHLGDAVRPISTRTGDGVKELLQAVIDAVQTRSPKLGKPTANLVATLPAASMAFRSSSLGSPLASDLPAGPDLAGFR